MTLIIFIAGNTACQPCDDGYTSNQERTACVKVDEDFLEWQSPFSALALVFCFLGVVFVLFIIAVFRKYSKTAVVKASNREVSLVHLTSHALVFLLPPLYIGRPTVVTCVIRLNLFPVFFTFITAIMFLKTDRIVRIFNSKSRLTKRSRLLSNKVQFVLTFVLTLIPVLGTIIWLVVRPVSVKKKLVDETYVVFCENEEACQVVQLSYIVMLALLCTYEAFCARKLPESFNEAKFICFSMFAFVLMWAGYIPVCLDITGSTKQFMTGLFILLVNFLTVMLIYLPKLNIILLHPDHNRHESFRKPSSISGGKESHKMSPVGTPTTSHAPKLSVGDNGNPKNGINITDETDRKMRSISTVTDVSFGSNEQLVAQHLGLPPATRQRNQIPDFDSILESTKNITSV